MTVMKKTHDAQVTSFQVKIKNCMDIIQQNEAMREALATAQEKIEWLNGELKLSIDKVEKLRAAKVKGSMKGGLSVEEKLKQQKETLLR